MTYPFARINVDNLIDGNIRLTWEMDRHLIDVGPYSFQLQVGHTALEDADDWVDVGAPVVDTYTVTDTTKRLFGKTLDVHYRLELTTSTDTYISHAVSCEGLLSKRDWLTWQEVLRKERLRHSTLTSVKGYLLKARRYGTPCPVCLDEYTEEVSKSKCMTCYGTGFEGGYFTPLEANYADLGLQSSRDHRNANIGMQNEHVIQARFLGDILLYSYDVWINAFSDERYYVQTTQVSSQIRGVPISYNVELRLAPFSDIIYSFDINKTYPQIPPGLT